MYNLTLAAVFRDDKLFRAWECDFSVFRIFDAVNLCRDFCLDFGFLERKVSVYHLAVYKFKVCAVAERLRAGYRAVNKRKMVGVPCKIFAVDYRIAHCYVFAVPERVLCVEVAVGHLHVVNILERVFAFK